MYIINLLHFTQGCVYNIGVMEYIPISPDLFCVIRKLTLKVATMYLFFSSKNLLYHTLFTSYKEYLSSFYLCITNNNNNNPICKAPECQKTSVALTGSNVVFSWSSIFVMDHCSNIAVMHTYMDVCITPKA